MAIGTLQIKATTASQALPLSTVQLEITLEDGSSQTLLTGANGIAETLSIEAPEAALSLDPNYTGVPYATVDLRATKEGYQEKQVSGIQIFAGELSILELDFTPNMESLFDPELSTIDQHSLLQGVAYSCEENPNEGIMAVVLDYPIIPKYVVVHLGRPTASATNVSVTFKDYIKNVASSEIYPTWPTQSLRANITCQISLALNRVYTEWYRSRGYDFDITNSTAYDQYFVQGRNIFESISRVVDEIFNEYVRMRNTVDPYYAEYCDGRIAWCNGLKQWGTVTLANQGYNAFEILQYYYGNNLEMVVTDRIEGVAGSYPGLSLRVGTRSDGVATIQNQLNRIAVNYPNIPPTYPVDGIFGDQTRAAVLAFQAQFNLSQDGIVGKATWYKISYIYVAVKKLAELTSEGVEGRVQYEYPGFTLRQGDRNIYVQEIQFFLQKISYFTSAVNFVKIDSNFGSGTRAAVISFQRLAGITADGIVGIQTWNALVRAYRDTLQVNVPSQNVMPVYPGTALRLGSSGENVSIIQNALNAVNQAEGNLSLINVDGIFGAETERAVRAYQSNNGLTVDGIVGRATWNSLRASFTSVRENPIAYSAINYELFQALYRNYTSLLYDMDNEEKNQ